MGVWLILFLIDKDNITIDKRKNITPMSCNEASCYVFHKCELLNTNLTLAEYKDEIIYRPYPVIIELVWIKNVGQVMPRLDVNKVLSYTKVQNNVIVLYTKT